MFQQAFHPVLLLPIQVLNDDDDVLFIYLFLIKLNVSG